MVNLNFIEKLLKIDRRWIFLLVAVTIIIPIIHPLNLPVKVTKEVRGVFDEIEKLPPGTKVLVTFDYEPSSTPEMDPMAKAVVAHCFNKGLRVVGISWLEQGRGNADKIFSFMSKQFKEQGRTLEYGVDYAYMGFKPGQQAMILGLCRDFKGTCNQDYKGNDVYSMPILDGIENLGDFAYLIGLHDDSMINHWITYGHEVVGIKIGSLCTAVMAPGIYANLNAGQLTGIVGGLKGASEYEKLLDYRGDATSGMDVQTVLHVLIVFFILLGNFAYLVREYYLRKEIQ